jgi:hypothetical protein
MIRLPRFSGVLALVLLFVFVTQVIAKEARGTITRVGPDIDVFMMMDKAGDQWIFRLAPTAQVLINGEERSLLDLRPGDDAAVTFEFTAFAFNATIVRCVRYKATRQD